MVGDAVGDLVGSNVTSISGTLMGLDEGISDGAKLGYKDGTLLTCKSISPENAGSESRIIMVKSITLVIK